ncbi:elongin-A [Entomortierella parvispora]|uniref:Elongin-A n=1 Tax=Entomortierella parvispora TaxID=205924 RepID=A0A9P3HAP3_9FUNG|nr:elongin-A [Entomortierella parvispora]
MAFFGTGHRLGSEWGSDFVGEDGRPVDVDLVGRHPAEKPSGVPSLRDICISTLDRYVDLLEDLGATPYYLIESVLKKCSVKQLMRIEEHTEGLDEMTDELWYHHALNKYKDFREESSTYDQSGEWRAKYQAKEQEELERYERERAKLRQSYSRHDKIRQDRSVIVDPTLRLPKKTIRPASGSGWGSVAPKKKTLFEKAREEARKITQMYKSNPYPPPKSRAYSTNTPTNIRRPVQSTTVSRIQPPMTTSSRHVIAPNSVFAGHQDQIIPLGNAGPGARTTKARYNYKVRPVVYTTMVKQSGQGSNSSSTIPQHSPTRSSTSASASNQTTASAPGAAIADFFKEINPVHTRHSTTSHQDAPSRSPTSPVQPPSKTLQQLRETPVSAPAATTHTPRNLDPPLRAKKHARTDNDREAPQYVKNDGDFRWLEEDDDDEYDNSQGGMYPKTAPHPLPPSKRPHNSQGPAKKTMTEEEAAKLFFSNLMGK